MSVESVIARIAQLDQALQPQRFGAARGRSFASVLGAQSSNLDALLGPSGPPAATFLPVGVGSIGGVGRATAAQRIVQAAQGEVGQAEQPPGSNDSPRIAMYRTATAGSAVGPWCAYFASWCAQQAGVPVGEQGQGFGSVDALYAWAQRTGRAVPAGAGVRPNPGDFVVWDEHIGVVESVDPDGTIHTIEGNSSNQVARRTYGADGGGAIGFVRNS